MRAFVSGGSGFIGGHLLDHLLKAGWQVRVLVHQSQIPREAGIELLNGDICDRDALEEGLRGVDVLFHLASALGSSTITKSEFTRVNASGTVAVLAAARSQGVRRVIHVSSAGVLGAVKENEIADETYPPRPVSIYDKTKLEGERAALRSASEGMDVVVVRPGWAYGPRDRRTFKLIRAIAANKFIMATAGRARQTPVYVDDLITGILACAEKGKRGEVYHLAGDEILTAGEIAAAIAAACGTKIPRLRLPGPAALVAAVLLEKIYSPFRKEPPLSRAKLSFFTHSKPLSIQKAKTELGFFPRVRWGQGIRLAVSWYRANGWL